MIGLQKILKITSDEIEEIYDIIMEERSRMLNKSNLWEKIDLINEKLEKELLCVPFCYAINGEYVEEIMRNMNDNEKIEECIFHRITLPYQRAYQMEYRYKNIDIFEPFLKVLEYATYDFFNGNLICAYLSLIPVVESIFRRWGEKNPKLAVDNIRQSIPDFVMYLKNENDKNVYNKELKKCFEYEIKYMETMLELLYENFKQYAAHNFSDIFNRNLSLHKLQGVSNHKEIKYNLNRLYLLIDVIADLYTINEYDKYFKILLYADSEDEKFKLRWKYYQLIAVKRLKYNDMDLLEYYLNNEITKEEIKNVNSKIDKTIELISKNQ